MASTRVIARLFWIKDRKLIDIIFHRNQLVRLHELQILPIRQLMLLCLARVGSNQLTAFTSSCSSSMSHRRTERST